MAGAKLNPTLFDKLIVNTRLLDVVQDGSGPATQSERSGPRFYTVSDLERFNEGALRATVRRELAWLFNTTNFGATQDLTPFPEVKSSVLNYGMPDLTGRVSTARSVQQRTEQIRDAIIAFEPRMDADKIAVEAQADISRDNAVTFVISGDVTSAVKALPVRFLADVEVETGAAIVRD